MCVFSNPSHTYVRTYVRTYAHTGIKVLDTFDVTDVRVSFNLTYTRMGALNIALQALEPRSRENREPEWSPAIRSSTLMARDGRKQKYLTNIEFRDSALEEYPNDVSPEEDALPPSTGTFKPKTPLADIAYGQSEFAGKGGSRGWWRLVVRDVADAIVPRYGALNSWTLILCGREVRVSHKYPTLSVWTDETGKPRTTSGYMYERVCACSRETYASSLYVSSLLRYYSLACPRSLRQMPEEPSEDFIQNTITELPEGSVPKTNEFVNPANSTVPDAIQESTIVLDSTEIDVTDPLDNTDVSTDAELPLENTFADDSNLLSNPGNGVVYMPIWEYGRAWTERIAIRLGLRMY